jgi:hypothetical protein
MTRSLLGRPLVATIVVAAMVVATLGATACGEPAPATRAHTAHPDSTRHDVRATPAARPSLAPPRHPLPPRLVRWLRGGSERDTLLAFPTQAVADSTHLYILDAGRGEIVALHSSSGEIAWRRATTRHAPRAITALPGGGLAVADGGPPAITLLDATGRLRATRALPPGTPPIRSLCALSATHFVAATADSSRTLLDLRDDSPPRPLPLPWPDLAARHFLTAQTSLAGDADAADGRCAIALLLGRGFALYDGARYSAPTPYVEPFDLPGITRTRFTDGDRTVTRDQLSTDRTAARAIALTGDRLLVSFGGQTALAAYIVDVYDARSGAYLGTSTLPQRVSSLAAHGRDFYVLYSRHGRPAVAALTDTTTPPSTTLTRR